MKKKSWLNFQNGDMGVQTMNNMLYRKVKETEDKMKEKCYELKDKIDQFISHAKYKIHRKRNRTEPAIIYQLPLDSLS